MSMALQGRRALFISYTGMLEPLGQSQVIPYLLELSAEGVEFTLLSFEREDAFSSSGRIKRKQLEAELSGANIEWKILRYHRRLSLLATIYDVFSGIRCASVIVKQKRIELVHARSHIPAAIAIALKSRFGVKVIFDVRGLMAEEYVDAGHWIEGDLKYRITKAVEKRALAAADGVVTLTKSVWPLLEESPGLKNREVAHQVVPCCVNLEKFRFKIEDRMRRRRELGLDDQLVLVYSGSIGGWYYTEQMVDFFSTLLEHRANSHFLWLTMGDRKLIDQLMRARRISDSRYTVLTAASADVPSYLSASDAGIAFYKPTVSRLATSPVKVAEYVACGLPVIFNKGIGDLKELLGNEKIALMADGFTSDDFGAAIQTAETLLAQPQETRQRARTLAEKYFNVREVGRSRYLQLYLDLLTHNRRKNVSSN